MLTAQSINNHISNTMLTFFTVMLYFVKFITLFVEVFHSLCVK